MSAPGAPLERLWLVGTGRAAGALALMLRRSGALGELRVLGRAAQAPDWLGGSELGPAAYTPGLNLHGAPPSAVVLAVADGALGEVAGRLAAERALAPGTPVLHLSGALDAGVLEPLRAAGASTGALHPLAALADPATGAERLRGAWYATEAEGRARTLADAIIEAAGGRALRIAPGEKPLYHAAAVLASNAVTALLGAAEGWMTRAGAAPEDARAALAALAAGAVENTARRGAAGALTGPVARGEADTVRRHLQRLRRLSAEDAALYCALAEAMLPLAREQGLAEDRARRIAEILKSTE